MFNPLKKTLIIVYKVNDNRAGPSARSQTQLDTESGALALHHTTTTKLLQHYCFCFGFLLHNVKAETQVRDDVHRGETS